MASLARRESPTSFRYATAAGTATLLNPGTELCQKADVHRFVPQATLMDA